MKTIYIGFSYYPGSLLSWLIRKTTASQVSHVYSVVVVAGEPMVYQASGLTVNYTAMPVFLSKNRVVEEYAIEVSDEQYDKAKKLRLTQVGKPYSMIQLVGFFWVLGGRKFGKNLKNPFSNGDQAYVCCEITAESVGLKGGENLTPEDFRRWCSKNGRKI